MDPFLVILFSLVIAIITMHIILVIASFQAALNEWLFEWAGLKIEAIIGGSLFTIILLCCYYASFQALNKLRESVGQEQGNMMGDNERTKYMANEY